MSAETKHNIIESRGWVVRDFRFIIVIVNDCQNTTAVSAVLPLPHHIYQHHYETKNSC